MKVTQLIIRIVELGKGQAQDDNDEPKDEDTGDNHQIKRQRHVTHSSEEDKEVKDERVRVSLNSY